MIALHRLVIDSFTGCPHHDFRALARHYDGICGGSAPLTQAISSAARLEERTRRTW